MACLRRAPLEGCSGIVFCDEEGCKQQWLKARGGTVFDEAAFQADRLLQFRLRAGDVEESGEPVIDFDNAIYGLLESPETRPIKSIRLHSISLDAEPGPGGGRIESVEDVARLGLRHDEQDPDNPIRKEVERKVGIIRNEHVFDPSVAEENLKAFKREFEHAGDILQQNRHRSVPPYTWYGPDPEPVVTYEEGCACGGCEARRFLANYTGGV